MPLIRGLDLGDAACSSTTTAVNSCRHDKHPLAFLVVGDARAFIENATWNAYQEHVLRSFGAHPAKQLFLYLKHDAPRELESMISAMNPARVRVVPRTAHGLTLPSGTCMSPWPSWHRPEYQNRAMLWWGALEAAWGLVREFEAERSITFAGVFVSRPDLLFQRDFGPRCLYDRDVWYTGGLGGPDWLWLMPRHVATQALTTASEISSRCNATSRCCELQHVAHREGKSYDERHRDDWAFSYWILRYWTLRSNLTISTRLRGHAHLITKPPDGKVIEPYAHVGCGAPNCGRYTECLGAWKDLHHESILLPGASPSAWPVNLERLERRASRVFA
jgi:hypothetical protein